MAISFTLAVKSYRAKRASLRAPASARALSAYARYSTNDPYHSRVRLKYPSKSYNDTSGSNFTAELSLDPSRVRALPDVNARSINRTALASIPNRSTIIDNDPSPPNAPYSPSLSSTFTTDVKYAYCLTCAKRTPPPAQPSRTTLSSSSSPRRSSARAISIAPELARVRPNTTRVTPTRRAAFAPRAR